MASTTVKTIGLVLLVFIILTFFFRSTPFLLTPLGIFPGAIRMMRISGDDFVHIWPFDIFKHTFNSILPLALMVLWIFVIVWVYRDAERRGMNGVLWALLVFIGNLIGLLIYLIVRSDIVVASESTQTTESCPSCQKPVDSDFVFCPNCGARMQAVCPKCEKPIENTWRVCPNCGKKLIDKD